MKDDKTKPQSMIFKYDDNDDDWVASLNRRIDESKSHWNSKYKLDSVTKSNEELYLATEELDDEDNETSASDNRIFSSIRTIVPYVTSRITQPEVIATSSALSAKKFAEDLEKGLYFKADDEEVKLKAKFAIEDAIKFRRGYLKPRYDALTKNFCSIEYVPADSIIIDHKSLSYEEPRYFRHVLDKTIEDMLVMFPEMKAKIQLAFGIDDNAPKAKLEESHQVNEDWCSVPAEDGLDLMVTWSYKDMCLGKMQDPNWNYDGDNFLKSHMMPLVMFNVLSDGKGHIDKTSFVEQAKKLQRNVNERSEQISKSAGLGNTGMPVVDSEVLGDDQAQYLSFDEDTVLELSIPEGSRISDHFDVWKAGTLPQSVYDDKIDSRNSIDNTFGTPNIFRGEQSNNNTLGQDEIIRDQAFGRQQEIVDAIDRGVNRLYKLMAQFLVVYGDEEELLESTGDNGEFDYVVLHTADIAKLVKKIRVKAGTSMPIDKSQRRAVADKAATYNMIDPLTYWEIMDEGNAEKYAKRLVKYTTDPATFMQEVDDGVFSRDAFVDIQLIKNGVQPKFREDLNKEYFDHLNKYILSGNLDNPTLDPMVAQSISQFIDIQLARGQKMLGLAETQMPTPEEVNAANEKTDILNQQDQAAADQEQKAAESQAKIAKMSATPVKQVIIKRRKA